MKTSLLARMGIALSLIGVLSSSALAALPSDFGLQEGDMISSAQSDGNPDIFIINQYGYKRVFLNEAIFHFYGHLKFSNVRQVSGAARDAFKTSLLFRDCEASDARVFVLEVTGGDTGTLHPLAVSEQQATSEDPDYPKKVFCINNAEYDWYTNGGRSLGSYYTSLAQIPGYGAVNFAGQNQPTPTQPFTTPSPSISSVFTEWAPSVALLICGNKQGSGTIFKSNRGTYLVLTNAHVTIGADYCLARFLLDPARSTLTDSNTVIYWAPASNINYPHADEDLAEVTLTVLPQQVIDNLESSGTFLTSESKSLDYLTSVAKGTSICRSEVPKIGDDIILLGYPGAGSNATPTVVRGIISGLEGNYYVTDAKIEAGISGGAAILAKPDCYIGIPTGTRVGDYESIGRILDITRFGRVTSLLIPDQDYRFANILNSIRDFWR